MPKHNEPGSDTPTVKDITKELYKKNIELFKERQRTAELLYRVSEGIYATDENCKITLFNHTLERMLHINAIDAMGKDAAEIIRLYDESGNPIDVHTFCNPDLNEEEFALSAVLITRGKNYYVHVKISVIETKTEGKEYLVTMSDVTQEKELEKEKDEFISITSHELKTPMSIIKSYLWMLSSEKGGTLTDKQKHYIDNAMVGTDRLVNLVNDMLKISRMEQGKIEFKFENVDLSKLLNRMRDEFELLTGPKQLELAYDINDNIPQAYTDYNKLIEILMNLVSNASKYTSEGSVTIKLENVGDGFVKLSVKDTGRGIAKEEVTKLFKKFQRLDNSFETMAKAGGTGLGLYIIKMYMASLGGSVGVESEGLNKGSTFWITLPTRRESIVGLQ